MYLPVDVPVLYTANPFAAVAAQRSGVKLVKASRNQVSCTTCVFHCL